MQSDAGLLDDTVDAEQGFVQRFWGGSGGLVTIPCPFDYDGSSAYDPDGSGPCFGIGGRCSSARSGWMWQRTRLSDLGDRRLPLQNIADGSNTYGDQSSTSSSSGFQYFTECIVG